MTEYVQGAPIPKSMGRVADEYAEVRETRLLMEKEVDAVKARETELREYMIANLSKSGQDGDTGAAGLRYRCQLVMKVKPRAEDWPTLFDFVRRKNRFDLLQKRLGEKAVADMWAAGEEVPGVEKINVPDISITKIK